MIQFTHEKIPYKARCVQFDGSNHTVVCSLFKNASAFRDSIIIRHQGNVMGIQKDGWCVVGEDSVVRVYRPAQFALLYRECRHTRFTHEKIPYQAVCMRFNGRNAAGVCALFEGASLFRDHIMIRHKDGVCGVQPGNWCLIGEDHEVRVYSHARFFELYRRKS